MYAQLAVLDSEKNFLKAPATEDRPGTHGSRSVEASASDDGHASGIPLIGWDLMREFFQVFCGVPELLMLSSRRCQLFKFNDDVDELGSILDSARRG